MQLHVGLACARCLRTMEARGFHAFLLSPATLCLSADEPLDPARCLDCVPPKGAATGEGSGPGGGAQFAAYRQPGAAGAAADADDPCDAAACVAATGVLGWALTMLHVWLGRSPFVGLSLADIAARAREGVLAEYLQPLIDAADLDLSLRDLLKACATSFALSKMIHSPCAVPTRGPLLVTLLWLADFALWHAPTAERKRSGGGSQECVCDSAAKRPTARSLHNQLKTLAPLLVPPLLLYEEARRVTGLPARGGEPAEVTDPLAAPPPQPGDGGVFVAVPVAAVAAGGAPGAFGPGGRVPAGAPPAPPGQGPPVVAGNHAAACGSPAWWRKFCVRACCFVILAIVLRWVVSSFLE